LASTVRRTGPATTGAAGYANTGFHYGDVYLTRPTVARSAYLEQVERISPNDLVGREAELAELAAFCLDDNGPGYMWWQAPAWAGKSALMSWFALHPPAGVRVVAFFITARYAGNSDRNAFLDVMLEQLAEAAGQPAPSFLTEATREPWLLRMLKLAAESCIKAGERLALVVDGLDEDRGVTVGPDAHSIAALLPSRLPHAVRIVVAGRSDPPVPKDVPHGHPLRDRGIVRQLTTSPMAQVVREDAERELEQLLHGSTAEQDLLGLVAAAGGGLSGADLSDLTGSSAWEIEQHLRAVSGRTFRSHRSNWHPGGATEIYVLAHEELQNSATQFLGDKRLAAYQERLHRWAESYRDQCWPAETPEYLLRGYYRLLSATNDVPRMVTYGTDQTRHDRMLDITGGDAASLTEIANALDAISTHENPDLAAMCSLAISRDWLIRRNANIPLNLPAAWAIFGNPTRAIALVRCMSDLNHQTEALAMLVELMRVSHNLADAEAVVRSIANPHQQAQAMIALIDAVMVVGDLDKGRQLIDETENVIHSIGNHDHQEHVLVSLARVIAASGDITRGESAARSIKDPERQAQAFLSLAEKALTINDPEKARQLVAHIEVTLRSIVSPDRQAQAQASLVKLIAATGNLKRAKNIAYSILDPERRAQAQASLVKLIAATGNLKQANDIIASIDNQNYKMRAQVSLVATVAATGSLELAQRIARSITGANYFAEAQLLLAKAITTAGDLGYAKNFVASIANPHHLAQAQLSLVQSFIATGDLDEAKAVAHCITGDPSQLSIALITLSEAVAATGDADEAHRLASQAETASYSIVNPRRRASVLVKLAIAVAGNGDMDEARRIVTEAEAVAHSSGSIEYRAKALLSFVDAIATIGDFDLAESLANSIDDAGHRAGALASVCRLMAAKGEFDRAESLAHCIDRSFHKQWALAWIVKSIAISGDFDRAYIIARSISHKDRRGWALAAVVEAVSTAGDFGRARSISQEITRRKRRAWALGALTKAIALTGELDEAKSVVSTITSSDSRAWVLAGLAQAIATTGQLSEAHKLVNQAQAIVCSITNLERQAWVLAPLAQAVAALGDYKQASDIARSINNPDHQAHAFQELAKTAAASGEFDKAKNLALLINNPERRGRTLVGIVSAMASAGKLDQAIALTQSLEDIEHQARAFGHLARNLEIDEARRTLARAIRQAGWTVSLDTLTQIEPTAIKRIAVSFARIST
jgi:tetratricopeptide (TPR) repeat protein